VAPLSRRDSGKLASPAHGGLWIHQAGGAKIAVPEDWLIGVADDRQIGATLARDKMHVDFTAGVEISSAPTKEIGAAVITDARRTLQQKGYTIVSESEEPFHSYPCIRFFYEGTLGGRFVRGQDLWVASPRGRWLFSIEGDGPLLRKMANEWQGILDGIQFL